MIVIKNKINLLLKSSCYFLIAYGNIKSVVTIQAIIYYELLAQLVEKCIVPQGIHFAIKAKGF